MLLDLILYACVLLFVYALFGKVIIVTRPVPAVEQPVVVESKPVKAEKPVQHKSTIPSHWNTLI